MGILRMIDEISIEESDSYRESFVDPNSLAEDLRRHRLESDSVQTLVPYNEKILQEDFNQEYLDTFEDYCAEDYEAVVGDRVDLEMAHFLNEDPYGKTVSIPVVRLAPNTYQIGLLKYSLRTSIDYGLIGANTGLPLHDMILKIHSK